tara:strand:+ start:339 stop:1310 length:972 start_codon:yes stop_codon:yes gene_type:complete
LKNKIFIIAEIGNSHNGNLKYALNAINFAKKAGADAVKFQFIKPEKLVHPNLKPYNLRSKYKTQLEKFKKITLQLNDYKKLSKYAKQKKIKFGLSIFDLSAVEEVKKIVDFYKIASGDLKFENLIKKTSNTKKKVIISTGISNLNEIKKMHFKKNVSILHCLSKYPSNSSDLGMNTIYSLKKKFKKNIIGYSDHTNDYLSCLCAVSIGAKIIEKHFIINYKNKKIPDYNVSIDHRDFNQMVISIREIEKMLSYKKNIPNQNRNIIQRSWYAKREIKKNTILSEKNCIFLRPFNKKGLNLNLKKKYSSKKKINRFDLITKDKIN